MDFPIALKYTKDHEWVQLEGDEAIIGITAFAQRELGDIVFVDINSINEEIEQGEVFGTIEAVKTVSDLFMPVTGTVLSMNDQLDLHPESVNKDPYGNGWLVRIKVKNSSDVDSLLSAEEYKEQIGV